MIEFGECQTFFAYKCHSLQLWLQSLICCGLNPRYARLKCLESFGGWYCQLMVCTFLVSAVFMKIIGHIGHFWWLGPNVWWEISQIWIEYIKPIGQMSDESWKFFGYTVSDQRRVLVICAPRCKHILSPMFQAQAALHAIIWVVN